MFLAIQRTTVQEKTKFVFPLYPFQFEPKLLTKKLPISKPRFEERRKPLTGGDDDIASEACNCCRELER